MSRKRNKQRGDKRELARQLEQAPAPSSSSEPPKHVDADELIAHARVTEPSMTATITLGTAKRGFFAKVGVVHAEVALYVVDGSGARLARALTLSGPSAKAPAVLALASSARGPETTRYTRPGSFVLVVALAEGSDGASTVPSLDDPARVTIDGKRIVDLVKAHLHEDARRVALAVAPSASAASAANAANGAANANGEAPAAFAPEHGGAGAVVIAAHHRVTTEVVVPVAGPRLSADVRVSLRV